MGHVVFADPLGSDFRAVELDEILTLLDKKGERYWNSASSNGTASLSYYKRASDEDHVAELVFTMKRGPGYHLYFERNDPARETVPYYAVGGDDYEGRVSLNAAGEKMKVPRALFVTRDAAAEAIKHFFRTGTRSSKVRWVRGDQLDWAP